MIRKRLCISQTKKGSVRKVKEKMDIYIEGMKQCSITMQVELRSSMVTLSYKDGQFLRDEEPVSEEVVRRALFRHYTANRRRVKDWADDVRFMVEQLEKQKVKS